MKRALMLITAVFLLGATALAAGPYNLVLAGASPGGLWSLIGTGVDRALKKASLGSSVTYQTSGGGYANIKLLQDKVVNLAFLHDAEANQAMRGKAPFSAPVSGLRALAVMYDFSAFQPLISKKFMDKYSINSFEDIEKKKPPVRITVNKRGNVTHNLAVNVLAAYGISLDDIKSWGGQVVIAGSRQAAELMRNRQADMTLNAPFVGHSSILEVASALPVRILPVSNEVISKVRKDMGIGEFVIPKNSYEWVEKDTPTLALAAMIAVNEDMDNATAQAVTSAFIDHISEIQNIHKAMRALTPKMMVSQSAIPFHPGAIKAYEKAGLM